MWQPPMASPGAQTRWRGFGSPGTATVPIWFATTGGVAATAGGGSWWPPFARCGLYADLLFGTARHSVTLVMGGFYGQFEVVIHSCRGSIGAYSHLWRLLCRCLMLLRLMLCRRCCFGGRFTAGGCFAVVIVLVEDLPPSLLLQ
ncbi:hypothetical protein GQ55_2G170600 [Panicum hallii var. hallii]|uniref:Uncharacterized protein n=1 Tax=Panicum hallii var. hallii TaxID=1504633 RepID=A0A2T7EQ32_9POAL|nr:hypothetical protein GQ55_2G170600 [Panicum hallii var. hallii]